MGVKIVVILSYDISNDKKRTQFNKFIKKFGHKLQYSVYQIDNSERILDNIMLSIKNKFEKQFDETDSVIIFRLSTGCEIIKYGYIAHEDNDYYVI